MLPKDLTKAFQFTCGCRRPCPCPPRGGQVRRLFRPAVLQSATPREAGSVHVAMIASIGQPVYGRQAPSPRRPRPPKPRGEGRCMEVMEVVKTEAV